MQALRRRSKEAQRHVAHRHTKYSARMAVQKYRQGQLKERIRNETLRHNVGADRKERWESWFLGPLRTGGTERPEKTGEGATGVLKRKEFTPDLRYTRGERNVLKRHRIERDKDREKRRRVASGGPAATRRMEKAAEDYIIKGDRVAVRAFDGPISRYRGRIGVVLAVDRQKRICIVEGLTIRQVRARKIAPNYKSFCEPNWDPELLVPLPIPFSHLRPVKTIINGAGEKEDVILGKLSPSDLIAMGRGFPLAESQFIAEEEPSLSSGTIQVSESEDQRIAREQASTNLTTEQIKDQLPPPPTKIANETKTKPKKSSRKGSEDTEDPTAPSDTLRLDVDTQTWIPTLLRAPLPGSVLDELRGKYSVFRSRHDPEYLKHLQRVDSKKQQYESWVKSGGGMLDTPRKEAAMRTELQKREAARRQGKVLDDKVLEGIGRLMWERGTRLTEEQEFETIRKWKAKYGGLPGAAPSVQVEVSPLQHDRESVSKGVATV